MLYMVKFKSVLWPARSETKTTNNPQEILRLKLFDEHDSEIEVECSKVKAFSPYQRIPTKRSKEWVYAYNKALAAFNRNQ